MSTASLFCLGAQVGRVWSSPYVLKVKFFPFILQAWSNLKQARDTASIHGKAACPLREGSGPTARDPPQQNVSDGLFLLASQCPSSLPVAAWASHGVLLTVSAAPKATSLHQEGLGGPQPSTSSSQVRSVSVRSGDEGSKEALTDAPSRLSPEHN